MTHMTDGRPDADHHLIHDSEKTAGIVSRGIAAMVDLVTVWLMLGAGYAGLALAQMVIRGADLNIPKPGLVFTTAAFVLVSIAYNTACWAISGRTAGCVVMGLRVKGRKRDRMRPAVALIRAVLYTFFAIGLFWVALDLRRRSIQDILLGTRVVYSR